MPSAQGEIVSIQGDRAVANVSQREARLFGETVRLPDGPFMLAFVAQVPIFPLFIARTSFHRYKIIAREPIFCVRTDRDRASAIEEAMQAWSRTLESVIAVALVAMVFVGPDFSEAMKDSGSREADAKLDTPLPCRA